MAVEVLRKLIDGVWRTVVADPGGNGGSQPFALATAGAHNVGGGYSYVVLSDDANEFEGGKVTVTATTGVPARPGAGILAMQGTLVVYPEFVVEHPEATVWAEMDVCNADASQTLAVGLDENIGIDPATGSPLWADAVWDVFNQVGADLSQADGLAPRVFSAAGGVFWFQVIFQVFWTPAT